MIKRYYYCVACGFHGDFKRPKKRATQCESCEYKDIVELTAVEYNKSSKYSKVKIEDWKKLYSKESK